MNLLSDFWHKICEPLDGFLWHKDISQPIIRTTLRNLILATAFFLLLGGAIYAIFPWLFWFGVGMAALNWVFGSWARFFLRNSPKNYGISLFRIFVLHFGLRLLILAVLLYLALAQCNAPASAILAGLTAGTVLTLLSYAINMRKSFNY